LGRKANPNLQDGKGDTPLITAARVGYADAVELLLSMGAKVDMTNRMGETPLIVAVQQRELAVVKLLLTNGANPDKADSAAGYSARDYAKRDARARDILAAIEASKMAKPTTKPADVKLDDFKLK
jgi:ankyrin repeat protein